MAATPEQLRATLAHCIGSENLYKHQFGIHYTDGIKIMAETAGAHWFIDLVASWQLSPKVRKEPFQIWTLTVTGRQAVARAFHDLPGEQLAEQEIEYTDFPPGEWKFYLVDGVLMVPGEY